VQNPSWQTRPLAQSPARTQRAKHVPAEGLPQLDVRVHTVSAGPAAQESLQATVHRLQRHVPEPSQSASAAQTASQRGVAVGFDDEQETQANASQNAQKICCRAEAMRMLPQSPKTRPDMARWILVSIRMVRIPPKGSIGVLASRVNPGHHAGSAIPQKGWCKGVVPETYLRDTYFR